MRKIFVVFCLALLASPSFAARPKYNQASIDYLSLEPSNTNTSLNGFDFAGEYRLNPQVLVLGNFQSLSKDNLDFSVLSVGGRYILEQDQEFDILLGGGFYRAQLDLGSGSASNTEIGLVAAVRKAIDEQPMQFEAGITLLDGGISLGGHAQYFFQDNLSARVALSIGDSEFFAIGASYWY